MEIEHRKKMIAELVRKLLILLYQEEDPQDLDAYEKDMNVLEKQITELALNKACMDSFHLSDEFNNSDGTFDVEGFVEKCFEKTYVIAV